MFYIKNGMAYVCTETAKTVAAKFRFPAAFGIVSIVCLVLSLLALLFRLGLHCALSDNDRASHMQVCLAGALLVANTSYLIGPFMLDIYPACYTVGVVIHWSYLAAFSWTLVVTFDICRMLRDSQRLRLIGSRKKAFVGYFIFAWGLPTVIVASAIVLDHCGCAGDYAPTYGKSICYISSKYSLLVFFVIPVVAHVTINIIFFILSAAILCTTQTVATNTGSNRARFYLYLRLLVLMGTTWLFGFLAVPLNSVALWYIFIVLNASQGVYLLLTYVTAKKTRERLGKFVISRRNVSDAGKGPVTDESNVTLDRPQFELHVAKFQGNTLE